MEGAVKGDHRRAPGGTTGDLQGVFGRLGAAVGEHAADRVFHRDKSAEALHQLDVGRMRCGVERVMSKPGGLLAYGRHHGRVAMAQVEYADTADKVDIPLARRVPDFGVFTVAQADGVNDGNRLADASVAHDSGTRQWWAQRYLSRAPGLAANEIKLPGHSTLEGAAAIPTPHLCPPPWTGTRLDRPAPSALPGIHPCAAPPRPGSG